MHSDVADEHFGFVVVDGYFGEQGFGLGQFKVEVGLALFVPFLADEVVLVLLLETLAG